MADDKEQWIADLVRLTEEDDQNRTAKQTKIVESAIEIFAEKGFAATSTSEIAKKAGVAEGTIFRHYKTKKDLLLSIAGPILVKMVTPFLLRDFAKVIDLPYERADAFFRAIVRDRLAFVRSHTKIIRILIHEVPLQPELLEQLKTLMSDIVVQRVQTAIEHFQAQGQIIEAPSWRIMRTAASLFIGMVVFHVFVAPEFPFDEEEEIERTIDLLMYGVAGRP